MGLSFIVKQTIPPPPACPDSVNLGTNTVYGPITNLCAFNDDYWPGLPTGAATRIVIPASENLYSGAVEWGHNFTVTFKSSGTEIDNVVIDMYLRDMDGALYDIDPGTPVVQFGPTLIPATGDLILGPVEFLMDGSKDILFEFTYDDDLTGQVPISSNSVSGHHAFNVSTLPTVYTELVNDSGKRALVVGITEVF